MTQPKKILNQIVVVEDFGDGDVHCESIDKNLTRKDLRSLSTMTAIIEFTDPATGRDSLVRLEGVRLVQQQTRESLFAPMEIIVSGKPQKRAVGDPGADSQEIASLRARVAGLERKLRDQSVLIKKHKVEMDALKVEMLALAEKIHAVEVWTFDKNGIVSDHYKLDVSDMGEEIAIGNVVVKLTGESP